jgi:hypothetical protein
LRQQATDFMTERKEEYANFIDTTFEEYITEIRQEGKWGGHLELAALCDKLQVSVSVFVVGTLDVIEVQSHYKRNLKLSFSGNHYNSIRPISKEAALVSFALEVCDKGDPVVMQQAMKALDYGENEA